MHYQSHFRRVGDQSVLMTLLADNSHFVAARNRGRPKQTFQTSFLFRRVDLDDLHPGHGAAAGVPRGAPEPVSPGVPPLPPGDHHHPPH